MRQDVSWKYLKIIASDSSNSKEFLLPAPNYRSWFVQKWMPTRAGRYIFYIVVTICRRLRSPVMINCQRQYWHLIINWLLHLGGGSHSSTRTHGKLLLWNYAPRNAIVLDTIVRYVHENMVIHYYADNPAMH